MSPAIAAECIYKKKWIAAHKAANTTDLQQNGASGQPARKSLSAEDDAKLVFGTIFSLRNMVRKLGGPDDKYVIRSMP